MTEEEIKKIKDKLIELEDTIEMVKCYASRISDREAQLQIRLNIIENNIKKLNLGFPIL